MSFPKKGRNIQSRLGKAFPSVDVQAPLGAPASPRSSRMRFIANSVKRTLRLSWLLALPTLMSARSKTGSRPRTVPVVRIS